MFRRALSTVKLNAKPAEWHSAKPFKKIPGPKPFPILGNMPRFLPPFGQYANLDPKDFQLKLFEQYGNIFAIKGLWGLPDMIVVKTPEDIETVFRNDGVWPIRNFARSYQKYRNEIRYDIFKGVNGILTEHNEEWHSFRSKVNPILMQPKVSFQYINSISEVTEDFIRNIKKLSRKHPQNQMPEDFLTEIYKWALESIGSITLDTRLGCLDLNPKEETLRFIDDVLEFLHLLFLLDEQPSFLGKFNGNWKRFVKVSDNITFTCLNLINEATAKQDPSIPESKMSILQKLLKKDKQVAIATALDMLVAGIDTTGKTLGAVLYFLAKHEDKQKTLRQELLKNLPEKSSEITSEILNNSPYLKAVIRETLRLSPIGVGIPRTTTQDFVLQNYQIPKGTEVICFFFYNANVSDKEYKNPQAFIPERWLKNAPPELSYKNASPFSALPFGFGPRSCIGKRLANLELEIATAKIIRNFQLRWPHNDMQFGGKLIYGIRDPLKLQITNL